MPIVPLIADLTFDGQVLKHGAKTFRATSGLPGYQHPDHKCLKDNGPVPEGYYRVFLADLGTAKSTNSGDCRLIPSWGIEKIPRGAEAGACEPYWANWGMNRARLEPANIATQSACSPVRGGFYIHDSQKGYSHGCIEVEPRFFSHLRAFSQGAQKGYCILQVRYVPGRNTNGGTRA